MKDFLTTSETDHSKVLFENENLKVSKSESMLCQRRFGVVFHLPGPFIKATKTLVSMELLGNNSGWTEATGNAFVCQLWQGPKRRMTFRSIVLLITFIRWLRWSIYCKTTRLRHTNEMQWTNWLPLTRKRYKALNVTCMLCLCKCHGHSDDILSNPIDFNMTNVTWRTWTTKYTPRIFSAECTISWCGNPSESHWVPFRSSPFLLGNYHDLQVKQVLHSPETNSQSPWT